MKWIIIIIIALLLLNSGDRSLEYDCYKKKAELRGKIYIDCK